MQRVIRPSGGINEWLHWLPLSLHKVVFHILQRLLGGSRVGLVLQGKRVMPSTFHMSGSIGLSSILEADSRKITTFARETFDK
jgi:hypothetical protein